MAVGATGQRSHLVLGHVVAVFNPKRELAPIQHQRMVERTALAQTKDTGESATHSHAQQDQRAFVGSSVKRSIPTLWPTILQPTAH